MLRGAGVPWCWLRRRGPPRPTTRAGRHARWWGEYLLEDLTALLLAMIDDGADQFGDDARGIQVAVPDRVVDQAIADSIGDGSIGDDLEPASPPPSRGTPIPERVRARWQPRASMTRETRTSMAERPETDAGSSRRNRRDSASGASSVTAEREEVAPGKQQMMEEVVERENMRAAYQQVRRNGGAPGIDGMSGEQLGRYLKGEWQRIREALPADRYQPQPVKRVEIAKPGGGVRQSGIPTVVDRMIQ